MTRKLILAAWALLLAAAVPAQQKEEFRLWPEAGKYAPERLGAGFDRDPTMIRNILNQLI